MFREWMVKWYPGTDLGFLKGGGWYLGIVESIGHLSQMLQFENWDLFENCYTGNNLPKPQNRNYNKVPVQSICLYFYHNIHNLFHFFSPKGGWLATQSTHPKSVPGFYSIHYLRTSSMWFLYTPSRLSEGKPIATMLGLISLKSAS